MPTIEELWMQIEVLGIGELVKATEAMDKTSSSTDRLRDAQANLNNSASGKSTKQQAQDIYDFADAYDVLGKEMDGVFTSAQKVGQAQSAIANTRIANGTDADLSKMADGLDKVEKSTGKAKQGAVGFGQSLLQVGRVTQDFAQGGVGGILNNIEGLSVALGLGSSIAGALTVLGVAFLTFKPQITEFFEAFLGGPAKVQGFIDKVKDLEGVVKGLLEKQGVSIVDLANLDNAQAKLDALKKNQASFNALANAQTNLQTKVAKGVKDVVVEESGGTDEESGAKNLAELMEAAQRRQGTFGKIGANFGLGQEKDALEKRLKGDKADFEAGASSPEQAEFLLRRMQADEDRLKTIGTQITDNARKANDDTIGAAGRGIESARKQIADLYDANQDVFATGNGRARPVGAGFRGKLELASPENIRAGEDFDRASKSQAAITKAQVEQEKKAADAKAAAEKARLAAAAKEVAEAIASPEYKEHQEFLKRRGSLDEFGRTPDTVGFDEKSAARVKAKANADIKKAKPDHEKLAPLPDQDKMQRQATGRQRQAEARQREALATQIHYDSGGGFNPDQSRAIAGKAIQMAKQNGDLSSSLVMAVSEMEATISHLAGRFQQQQQHVTGIRGHNQQVNRQLQQYQPSLLNFGGR